MPRLEIPSYNSRESIQPIQQAPLKKGESLQPFKDMEMVLSTGQKIVTEWQKAESVMQATEAKTDFSMATARLYQQAQEDPDFESTDRYKKAIDQAKKDALNKISNKQVRNQLAFDFDYDAQSTMIKVENDFRKKKIAKNEVVFTNATQQMLSNRALLDKKSEAYKKSEADYAVLLEQQKASGLLSDEQIQEINVKANKSVAEAIVYSDPQRARELINEGVFTLDQKEKHKLIEDSFRVEKAEKDREDYIKKQSQLKTLTDLSDRLITGELNPLEVRELQSSGVIDPEEASIFYAAALKKDYEIPPSTQTAEADYFLKLLDDAGGDKEIEKRVFKDAAKSYSNNTMGRNQYRFFVQEARKTLERQQQGSFTKGLGAFFSSIGNAIKSVGKKDKQQVVEDITGDLIGKDAEDPVVVNEATLKALAKVNPAYRAFVGKKVGETVTLPDGSVVKYNGMVDGDVDIEVIK